MLLGAGREKMVRVVPSKRMRAMAAGSRLAAAAMSATERVLGAVAGISVRSQSWRMK